MEQLLIVVIITVSVKLSLCDIAGLTYRDPRLPGPARRQQEDPCNPLYWYPRHIPDFCNLPKAPAPMPVQVPVPLPPPMIMPGPMPMAMPMLPGMLMPVQPYSPPGSFGAPMPMPGYPGPGMQAGFVPGLEGLVSSDGGINVLPFSDAYSDLLEKHKQKIIRIRLQKLLDRYDNYPRRSYRRRRKHGRLYEK